MTNSVKGKILKENHGNMFLYRINNSEVYGYIQVVVNFDGLDSYTSQVSIVLPEKYGKIIPEFIDAEREQKILGQRLYPKSGIPMPFPGYRCITGNFKASSIPKALKVGEEMLFEAIEKLFQIKMAKTKK